MAVTADFIKNKILQAYPEAQVQVWDLTGSQDHWQVEVTCPAFGHLTLIEQHQAIMRLFQNELLSGQIHALSLKTQAR